MMYRNPLSFLLGLAVLALFFSNDIYGQESKIKEADLPQAVYNAFHKTYPDARIIGAAKETEKGVTYFEIESKDGKVRRDLLYTKHGNVAEIEEALSADSIPDFVKKSIENKFKKVEFKRGEKNVRGSVIKYEVIIEALEVKYEVVCDENGQIIKNTKLKNKESDENDND